MNRFLFPFHVSLVDEEDAKECYPVIVVVDDGFAGVERTLVVADFLRVVEGVVHFLVPNFV